MLNRGCSGHLLGVSDSLFNFTFAQNGARDGSELKVRIIGLKGGGKREEFLPTTQRPEQTYER